MHAIQRVKIRNNGSLKVVLPKSSPRHSDLLEMAREWIFELSPPAPSITSEKTVIYYQRKHNSHPLKPSRAMDPEQDEILVSIIRDIMKRFGRREKLVVFDGKLSVKEQFDLFRSATTIIGAHGGGLANLLYTLPGSSCADRPKVLEFATNPSVPDVQKGSL